ncbi:uncharacterized protein LOC142975422 isoform X1 [Anticarsia gemmatalis]|uniref:uncharacterized protein LOC142975422 isoform X1 n=1 Tax=Anticarsia gemmatalis TaxID=129554 RepID=UPI003F76AFE4
MATDEQHLSLTWDAFQNNICSGLSALQQRGEFVDMTLAADGHHVKVHQIVMSLVSPYIKDLITTAKCTHPVIFLNNISYTTLCALMQYIYTGEVLVPKDMLPDLLAAGRALQIRGLRDVASHDTSQEEITDSSPPKKILLKKFQQIQNKLDNEIEEIIEERLDEDMEEEIKPVEIFVPDNIEDTDDTDRSDTPIHPMESSMARDDTINNEQLLVPPKAYNIKGNIQYSMSNQAGLQVIINRYIYNLKYVQKNLDRYWRCVDYAYRKCPASVYTNNKNQVLKRKSDHNHPFHDKKIMKKVQLGTVYTAMDEAESQAKAKKNATNVEEVRCPSPPKETNHEETE